MQKIPYIPEAYHVRKEDEFQIWYSPTENKPVIIYLKDLLQDSLNHIKELLKYSLKRKLHLCLFKTNQEAKESLKRDIPPTMLMAPFSSELDILIICQSENPHLQSRSITFKRHLIHEIIHAFVYDYSDSKKILGDGNKEMKVPTWFNEGLAECVSHKMIGKEIIVKPLVSIDELNSIDAYLNDLNNPGRELAFVQATGLVESFIKQDGSEYVFKHYQTFASGCKKDVGLI